jgi:hypothetical protein
LKISRNNLKLFRYMCFSVSIFWAWACALKGLYTINNTISNLEELRAEARCCNPCVEFWSQHLVSVVRRGLFLYWIVIKHGLCSLFQFECKGNLLRASCLYYPRHSWLLICFQTHAISLDTLCKVHGILMATHFFTFFNLDLEVRLVFPFFAFLKEMKWIIELNFF